MTVKARNGAPHGASTPAPPLGVLIVGPVSPPIGGIAACVEALLAHPFPNDIRISHLNTAKSIGDRQTRLSTARAALRTICRVPRAVRAAEASVVHIHTSSYAGFYEKSVIALVAQRLGCRVILHLHGGGFSDFYRGSSPTARTYIRRVLTTSARVVVLSAHWRRQLVEVVGMSAEQVAVVPNGVAAPRLRPRAHGSPVRTILTLGHLAEHKGVGDFIEAARLLCDEFPSVHFRHVGPALDAGAEQRFRRQARELEARGHFEWFGAVPADGRWEVLADADLFVLPSHVEGLPLALLEAMAAELPIVATTVGAIPEVIADGEEGLLVPPHSPKALADALRALLGSPVQRAELARRAAARAQREFAFARTAEQLESLYRAVGSGDSGTTH